MAIVQINIIDDLSFDVFDLHRCSLLLLEVQPFFKNGFHLTNRKFNSEKLIEFVPRTDNDRIQFILYRANLDADEGI